MARDGRLTPFLALLTCADDSLTLKPSEWMLFLGKEDNFKGHFTKIIGCSGTEALDQVIRPW